MTYTCTLALFYAAVFCVKQRLRAQGAPLLTTTNQVAMKLTSLIALLALMGFLSCKPAEITLSPELQTPAMAVKGRNGFQIGQVIRYGNYTTGKVRRGWTHGYDLPFVLRFQSAKEKMSYVQSDSKGQTAQVVCVSKFKSTELPIIQDFFGIPLDYHNHFAGNIAIGTSNWDFILHNPNGDFLREKASAGFAKNGARRIDIQAIRSMKGQPAWMDKLTVYGHEFVYEGKVVGAVSTVNRGKVWINETLDAETRVVLASMATGLLLRTDVEGTDMRTTGLN